MPTYLTIVLKGIIFMKKTSKDILKEFVNSQQVISTANIFASIKELFSDVLSQVKEAEI